MCDVAFGEHLDAHTVDLMKYAVGQCASEDVTMAFDIVNINIV